MKVHVISLKRCTERRKAFMDMNPHVDYLFFNAVDGSTIPEKVLSNPLLFEKGLPYTKGAYGCALSHLLLWNKAIKENCVLTIAEDDAIFRKDFHVMQNKLLSSISSDWDIILWGWNFDSILSLNVLPDVSPTVMVFSQEKLRESINTFIEKVTYPSSLFFLDKCFGIPAYTITPQGAIKFKSLCFPLKFFSLWFPLLNRKLPNNGIDIAMNKIYSSTNSYVSFPPLVVTKNEHAISTIQTNRNT
uniref:Glycosyl transferase, family 25 n=1 Tax=Chlorobium chlorochromatii (strain CaD3) TaxID=340177 RepID=Q3ASL1_CHLCH